MDRPLLPAGQHALLAGRSFFPKLIPAPFRTGLHEAFAFAIVACLVAAVASASRGRQYVDSEPMEGWGDRRPERGRDSLAVSTPVIS